MENNQNSVRISLEDYNGLRDFRANIEAGNTFRINQCKFNNTGGGWWTNQENYISTDLTIKEISEINENLFKHLKELEEELEGLKYPKKKRYTFEDFKNMSFLKIIIWKIRN